MAVVLGSSAENRRRVFALTLDDFPSAFRSDIEGFLSRGTDSDVFSDTYRKPLAKLTLCNRKRYVLMAATALVRTGMPILQITDLGILVEPANAKALLKFLHDRAGEKNDRPTLSHRHSPQDDLRGTTYISPNRPSISCTVGARR